MIKNLKEIGVPTSKVTLDDLALMVKNGFDHMDAKFDKVNEKFDKVDERFDKVDERFEGVDNKFIGIDGRLDRIEQSIYSIDTNVKDLQIRVGKIEYTLSEKIEPTLTTMQLMWRGHERRLGALERSTGLVKR